MDDRLKESLSALMDDEANELELQRVLSHSDKNELLEAWKAYHSVKSVLQHDQNDTLSIDISQSVSQAIAKEAPLNLNDELNDALDNHSKFEGSSDIEKMTGQVNKVSLSNQSGSLSSTSKNSSAGFVVGRKNLVSKISSVIAVAASIFVAFVFVLQNGLDGGTDLQNNLLASNSFTMSSDSNVSDIQHVNSLSASQGQVDVSKKQPKIIVEFTEEHARRFNEYLLRHAEHSVASSHASMIPLVRVASVNAVGI